MHDMGMTASKPHRKCARVVGEVSVLHRRSRPLPRLFHSPLSASFDTQCGGRFQVVARPCFTQFGSSPWLAKVDAVVALLLSKIIPLLKHSLETCTQVLGKYHPHGDTAVYNALVRLAQDFSMNAPLVRAHSAPLCRMTAHITKLWELWEAKSELYALQISGHGNFGSMDNDPAAAMRYTECRLDSLSSAMLLADLDPQVIPYSRNFDESQVGPVPVLRATRCIQQNICEGGANIEGNRVITRPSERQLFTWSRSRIMH